MNTENVKSQMRKGMLEYSVLLLLRRQPAYATDIITQLKNAELIIVEGTLYALTPEGEKALDELDTAWAALEKTVEILKNPLTETPQQPTGSDISAEQH